ncbi:hypothetical protein [Halobaculum roseum]|uniref:Uncharacterized protein n=1 Tax=Halobaculum roseum TaxID=2175149 RepID=A0ABD5MU22_9EURY|nr:hypothetical protein [Halobaculum roseum]QZY03893.1 hypothetical protein K6T36_06955 [Halobaculum roseum]
MTDPGPRDDGLRADYVDGEFVDSRLSVTGDPFVLTESRLDRRNVTVTDGTADADGSGSPCEAGDVGSDVSMDT